MPSQAIDEHLKTQLGEQRRKYEAVTRHIAAVDRDWGRETDSERKISLEERRRDLDEERDQIMAAIVQVERELSLSAAIATKTQIDHTSVLEESTTQEPNAEKISTVLHRLSQESLVWLRNRMDAQLKAKRITEKERDALWAIYQHTLAGSYEPEIPVDPDGVTDLNETLEGEAQMTVLDSQIVNFAESLFANTSRSLSLDLMQVVEYRTVWPELIVGDAITDKSIQVLNHMQIQMAKAGRIAVQHVAPAGKRRFQQEHDGMMRSARVLVNILEDSSNHMVRGKMPWRTIEMMEQQLDELIYYTNRCLLWLNDLSQSTPHTEIMQ